MRGLTYVWCAMALALGSAAAARAATITDNFGTSHDYYNGGFAGTIWTGLGGKTTCTGVDANTTGAGRLSIVPSQASGMPSCPFLYTGVTGSGDFTALVQVANGSGVNYAVTGLMVTDTSAANFVAMSGTPCTSWVNWYYDNQTSTGTWGIMGASKWFRIERASGVYSGSYSDNGTTWTTYSTTSSPSALGGDVRVGLMYWNALPATTPTQFDNFSLTTAAQTTEDIPEPCTLILLSAGLSGLVGRAWRRRK